MHLMQYCVCYVHIIYKMIELEFTQLQIHNEIFTDVPVVLFLTVSLLYMTQSLSLKLLKK